MAYASWSVVAGEQPTAAKWNILGTNDASFNDGSGLAFTTNGTVPANALKTTAITLGSVTSTTNMSTASGNPGVQYTGLTSTVTIPAGGRNIFIMASIPQVDGASGGVGMALWDGVVGSGTQLQLVRFLSNITTTLSCFTVVTPAAGSKTYNVGFFAVGSGSATSTTTATSAANLIILAI